VFGILEKPRVGRQDRVRTLAETEAILARASPAFRLIYSVLRQCGARLGERTYSRLRDLAGLPKDLVLYLARHECSTKICREKGIEFARRLLGHTNISTTQRFIHLDENELAPAQDLMNSPCES